MVPNDRLVKRLFHRHLHVTPAVDFGKKYLALGVAIGIKRDLLLQALEWATA